MQQIRNEQNDEIIVYLIDYKSNGDNYYDNVIFDFRTLRDWSRFRNSMQIDQEYNGLILINNFNSTKRLLRGCYYNFRADILKQIDIRPKIVEDSALFMFSFEFTQDQNINPVLLFDTHAPLDTTAIYTQVTRMDNIVMPNHIVHGKLRVNDVGQGNHNEILDNDNVVIVYDMGASLHSKQSYVEGLINNRIAEYQRCKPMLIISHWDYDHVIQLKCMSESEMRNCFSHVFCSNKTKSVIAQQIMRKLRNALPESQVHVIGNRKKTGEDYPLMKRCACMNGYSLYVGEAHRNINYSGLVLFVHGNTGNTLLTGDCLLVQASDVLKNEATLLNNANCSHKLVVPHHGGGYTYKKQIYQRFDIPMNVCGTIALISVGNDNQYGHPDPSVVELLQQTFNDIKTTQIDGSIVEKI